VRPRAVASGFRRVRKAETVFGVASGVEVVREDEDGGEDEDGAALGDTVTDCPLQVTVTLPSALV
jgi:hypothetical protein